MLSKFNKENIEYQANIQHTLARINSENNVNIQEAQMELQDKMKDAVIRVSTLLDFKK